MSPREFIDWLEPAVKTVCRRYQLFSSVCVAQAALESGWGKYVIGEYNLFGRKWSGSGSYIEKTTQEYIDGEWITIVDKFQDYSSLDEAVEDWCILLTEEPLYAKCLKQKDKIETFVKALAAVYATDPDYADNVLSIIESYNLTYLDA